MPIPNSECTGNAPRLCSAEGTLRVSPRRPRKDTAQAPRYYPACVTGRPLSFPHGVDSVKWLPSPRELLIHTFDGWNYLGSSKSLRHSSNATLSKSLPHVRVA